MEKKVYSTSGKELRTITLDDKVFGLPVNDDVIYYAITNELANKRVGTACTKTRSEVHGSNNKPYKQKGTGNARRGDKKSPITVGGGTIFGPKPRDFSYSIPKKEKRLAMKTILSMHAQGERLTVVEDFTIESGKTKDLVAILNNFAKGERTVLILKDDDVFVPVREIFVKDKVRQRTADRVYRVYGGPAVLPHGHRIWRKAYALP